MIPHLSQCKLGLWIHRRRAAGQNRAAKVATESIKGEDFWLSPISISHQQAALCNLLAPLDGDISAQVHACTRRATTCSLDQLQMNALV